MEYKKSEDFEEFTALVYSEGKLFNLDLCFEQTPFTYFRLRTALDSALEKRVHVKRVYDNPFPETVYELGNFTVILRNMSKAFTRVIISQDPTNKGLEDELSALYDKFQKIKPAIRTLGFNTNEFEAYLENLIERQIRQPPVQGPLTLEETIINLKYQINTCVQFEKYEKAAKLRDEIKRLEGLKDEPGRT